MNKIIRVASILLVVSVLGGCAYTIETGPQGTRTRTSIGIPPVGAAVVAPGYGYVPGGGGYYGYPYAGYGAAPIGWGWGWGGGWGGGFWGDGHHHHHHDGHHDGNDTVNNFNNDGDVNMGDGSNFDGADAGDSGGDGGGDGGGQ